MTLRIASADGGRPPRSRLLRGLVMVLCALAGWVGWAIGPGGCNRSEPAAAPPVPVVTVSEPIVREVVEWDEYIGRLEAAEFVEVRPRVSGMLESVHFQDGEKEPVKKDALLFKIDARPYQAELDRALGEVTKAEATLRFAAVEFANTEKVRKEGTGAVSELEYETKRQAKTQAEGALAAAKATTQAAKLNVDFTDVQAPITGRISRRLVTPGNLVTPSTLLTTMTGLEPIYCYVDADEASILKYQRLSIEKKRVSARDAPIVCYLNLANETDFPHEGYIDFVDNRLDPGTGTLQARGVFVNADNRLIPGFFGRLRVPGSGRYTAMLVPDAAVGTDQAQKFVLLVVGDTVEYRRVRVGGLFGTLRAIEEGIGPHDRVIVNGIQRARPGATVNATFAPLPPDAFKPFRPGSPATQALPPGREPSATAPSPAAPGAADLTPSSLPTTLPMSAPATPAATGPSIAPASGRLAPGPSTTAPAGGVP